MEFSTDSSRVVPSKKDADGVASPTPLVSATNNTCTISPDSDRHCCSNPISVPFLAPQAGANGGRKTLVLDLDETLIHSSFDPNQPHQFSIPVFVGGKECRAFVAVRPGVESFLENMSKLYEVVVYTASSQNVRAGVGDDV